MKFESLNLVEPLLRAVQSKGYTTPTPIQMRAIPLILEGSDVLACAQTGTGKTAAFALPILQNLAARRRASRNELNPDIRVLVLTPTRELATQIGQSFTDYGSGLNFRNTVIFGGVRQGSQVRALKQGVDIVIATPGRLLDLIQQKLVHFSGLTVFVLDEADRMLDMGFIRDVRKIITVIPKNRQTLFFSATMPPEIARLSQQILTHPKCIEVTPVSSTVEKIRQAIYHVDKRQKTSLLIRLLNEHSVERGLVFTRTKRDANRVSELLNQAHIKADAIHGNKSQNAREKALESIKLGQCRVLVATDIAARGIDIDQVTHVFNYDIPNDPESYVHRIGRTARAGASGTAFSLCAPEERENLTDIERLIKKKLTVIPTPEGMAGEMTVKKSPPRGPTPSTKRKAPPSPQARRPVAPSRTTNSPMQGKAAVPGRPAAAANSPASPRNPRRRRRRAV